MKKIPSTLLILTIKAMALLPLPTLYFLSDILFVLFFYLIRYRKKVVHHNLSSCFPNASPSEIKTITKQYYQHLCDLIVETIKAYNISYEELSQHIRFADPTFFQRLSSCKRPIIVVMGHTGNWEWSGLLMSRQYNMIPLYAVYRPIKDKTVDQFIRSLRTRFGAHLIPMHMIARHVLSHPNQTAVYTFIADQNPPREMASWHIFLGKETPFFKGYDTLAHRTQAIVVFVYICKISRGQYVIETFHACKEQTHESYVDLFSQYLEEKIRQQPFNWLWSHKRWKYAKN